MSPMTAAAGEPCPGAGVEPDDPPPPHEAMSNMATAATAARNPVFFNVDLPKEATHVSRDGVAAGVGVCVRGRGVAVARGGASWKRP